MIEVKHPLADRNRAQERRVSNAATGDQRKHELLFSYGNACYRYHERASEFAPSQEDYLEWLAGLPEPIREDMQQLGFDRCKLILSFTRYVNEKNDLGQEEYVQRLMGDELYEEYRAAFGRVQEG